MRLIVSIVNYKAAELINQMLPELIEQTDPNQDKIIIVDNDSQDDSLNLIKNFITEKKLEQAIDLVASDKNGGFSYGNNLAVNFCIDKYQASPEYIFLLNPDTRLKKDAIKSLVEFMTNNKKVGIAGSRLEDINGNPQVSSFRFPSVMSEILSSLKLGFLDKIFANYNVVAHEIPGISKKVDWIAGASMLIRYSLYEELEMMDERYFLYFEETDFCLQAKRKGWDCWYLPASRVLHYEGQSTEVVSNDIQRRRIPQYWYQSRQYYFLKNHGFFYLLFADLFKGLGFTVLIIRFFLQRKEPTYPKYLWLDFWRNSIFFSWIK
jgi:hypothetical protein